MSLLQATEKYLAARGMESPRRTAEILCGHLLGLKRIGLYVEYDRPVSKQELDRLREQVRRAGDHEPVQYIVGETDFYDFTLAVAPGVLIPRPETEGLVELVLERLEPQQPRRLLDLGTGSGCIAIALARHLPPTTSITALDISPAAIALARRNLSTHHLEQRVELVTGSVFKLATGETWDVIVSNPPYISNMERDTLPRNVRDYEPEEALCDGSDGLAFYRLLSAGNLLRDDGMIFCELPAHAALAAGELFQNNFKEVKLLPDLAGRTRFLVARK